MIFPGIGGQLLCNLQRLNTGCPCGSNVAFCTALRAHSQSDMPALRFARALLAAASVASRASTAGAGPGPPWGPAGEINCGGSEVCYRGCVPGSVGATFAYCNHSLTLEQRLDALVSEMSFDEKVMIMKAHAHGGCKRVGLPGYEFDSDGLHGYAGPCRNGSKLSCPTTFPAPATLGNAWNMSGIEAMGAWRDLIGSEWPEPCARWRERLGPDAQRQPRPAVGQASTTTTSHTRKHSSRAAEHRRIALLTECTTHAFVFAATLDRTGDGSLTADDIDNLILSSPAAPTR